VYRHLARLFCVVIVLACLYHCYRTVSRLLANAGAGKAVAAMALQAEPYLKTNAGPAVPLPTRDLGTHKFVDEAWNGVDKWRNFSFTVLHP